MVQLRNDVDQSHKGINLGTESGNSKIIDTGMMTIEVRLDGILRATPNLDVHSTLEMTKANLEYIKAASGGKKALILNDFRASMRISIDKDAREYMAGPEVAEAIAAFAVLVSNPVGKMFGNFWMRINNPPYPTRLFTTEKEAVRWLLEFAE